MQHDTLGRYSYVAAAPFATLVIDRDTVLWNDKVVVKPALELLKEKLALYAQPNISDLPPFQGGAIGYFSYEFGHLFERLQQAKSPFFGSIPDAELLFFDVIVAFDHLTRKAWIISTGLPEESDVERKAKAVRQADAIEAIILAPAPQKLAQNFAPAIAKTSWQSNFTPDGYAKAVRRVVEAILAGDIFQANISQRYTTPLPEKFDYWALYQKLRKVNPAPFSAFIDRGRMAIASSSPERFIKVEGNEVETRPIKGTARRTADAVEDQALAKALQESEKDRAENLMIVDLLRNDLSRVCLPGTVKTPELCTLETYASVHHLVSSVTGTLRPKSNVIDLLAASFPGGSITGAPKIKAMEIITEIEHDKRGVYCGAIGYLGFNNEADTNIAIRTVTFHNGHAWFQVGGGITALSDPEQEYIETLNKAARIFQAFETSESAS